jgi:hypothetical protein
MNKVVQVVLPNLYSKLLVITRASHMAIQALINCPTLPKASFPSYAAVEPSSSITSLVSYAILTLLVSPHFVVILHLQATSASASQSASLYARIHKQASAAATAFQLHPFSSLLRCALAVILLPSCNLSSRVLRPLRPPQYTRCTCSLPDTHPSRYIHLCA